MGVYESGDLGVEYKSDDSPLTLADKKCNEVINSYLKDTGIPIISEENRQIDFEDRKDWDTCWIVDPLDGTKEFVKRNGEFTVNIALCEERKAPIGGHLCSRFPGAVFCRRRERAGQTRFRLESHRSEW